MNAFQEMIEGKPKLQGYMFCRGFLLTDREDIQLQGFPFFGHWRKERVGKGYFAYVHELQKLSAWEWEGKTFFLFGHAYDPFAMEIDERAILRRIAEAHGKRAYQERIDELTGVFVVGVIDGAGVEFFCDPSGMQSACYGLVDGHFYIASHAQLPGDLCGLEMNALTRELLAYRWYGRVMGPYLPADMTQFDELKRVVPDITYRYDGAAVSHRRVWPLEEIAPAETQAEYGAVISQAADILRRNMRLVAQKWCRPAISLTGGIDSNTTFAAANGLYERFSAFSYVSAEKETIDAEAAEKIAGSFGVDWKLYSIPQSLGDLPDYEEIVRIIDHNSGGIARRRANECRKRVYLLQNLDCDVEVKSWVSETIRAYWYKHFGRKHMPRLSPKLFRNLYKIFLLDRKLAHEIDKVFERYIREFEYDKIPAQYPPADMHYSEVTWGSWGGLNISEMQLYSEITMIYNNRKFLELMFRVPLEKRISDEHHLDMKRLLNRALYDMGIRVVNKEETRLRAFLLNCIFTLNMLLP